MNKYYATIDLKSFYASVECRERGLDPLTTNLVVADESRTDKTICLAISPALKTKYHLPGRARLFEVRQKVPEKFIIAKPRMQHYLDYSAKIYSIYLSHVAPEDIYAYSIDEVFCDITSYLKMSNLSPTDFVSKIVQDVYQTTGITATAGIGTNLFLAKVAMDILAKHAEPNQSGIRIATLNEKSFREQLWHHTPITDFWRIGPGYAKRLQEHQMYTVGDIARCSLINEDLLYRLFGVNAELLIDHAWGYECVEIADIKSYRPHQKSFNAGQVLNRPYTFAETQTIIKEMAESQAFNLAQHNLLTDQLVLHISYDAESLYQNPHYTGPLKLDRYGRKVPKSAHGTLRLKNPTASLLILQNNFLKLFESCVDPNLLIRRVNLTVGNLLYPDQIDQFAQSFRQLNLFEANETFQSSGSYSQERETKIQQAILKIRKKFGNNAILRGTNFELGATGIQRNQQIGGHRA